MVGAELKNGAPQNFFLKFGAEIVPLKNFFSGFGAEMAPSSLKMQTVVFWSNLRPCNYTITGHGPAGPPLATALVFAATSCFYLIN